MHRRQRRWPRRAASKVWKRETSQIGNEEHAKPNSVCIFHPTQRWRPSLHDADDDMVLEVAVNGQADAIVTFNRRDFRPATAQFGIELLLPGAAIERLGEIS